MQEQLLQEVEEEKVEEWVEEFQFCASCLLMSME